MTSIAPDVPMIPQEAIDFAKEVGALAEKHGLNHIQMEIRVDTGYGTKYHRSEQIIQENMTVTVSRRDSRGRPRTQIAVQAEMKVFVDVVHEQDSTD